MCRLLGVRRRSGNCDGHGDHPLSTTASSAELNPVNSRLYVATTGSKVYVVNTSTNALVTSFSSPCNPTNGIATNPVTGKYYVIGLEILRLRFRML